MRDWARTSKKAEKIVRRVDDQRIALIQEIFEGFGYKGVEALIRARITYFHQVGYYALRINESRAERLRSQSLVSHTGDEPVDCSREQIARCAECLGLSPSLLAL
jgi:hypothetical protein